MLLRSFLIISQRKNHKKSVAEFPIRMSEEYFCTKDVVVLPFKS
jgi:hypothetical protein